MSSILEIIESNLSDVFVSLFWFPNLAPPVLTVPSSGSWGCVQHLQGSEQAVPGALLEHWCSPPSLLSLKRAVNGNQWRQLPSQCLLYATGFAPDREWEGKCWRGRSSRGHSDLAVRLAAPCLPLVGSRVPKPFCFWQSSTAGRMVTLPKSLPPGAFSIVPPKLEPGCPHRAMPSTCYCGTSKAPLPCSGAHVHTEPGVDFVRRLCESSCRWL